MADPLDVHQLAPEALLEEVHSFEFWFDAVEGYLGNLEHGRPPYTPEAALAALERERLVTVLCNYCIGETAALEGAGGLIEIAPNRQAKVFLATQTVDEAHRGFDEVPKKYRRFYRRWDGPGDALAPNEALCPVCKIVVRSTRELRAGDRLYCMACMTRLLVVAGADGRLEAQVVY